METPKKRRPSDDKSKYKWRNQVVLTKPEGAIFESIMQEMGVQNASQCIKKIVRGEYKIVRASSENESEN